MNQPSKDLKSPKTSRENPRRKLAPGEWWEWIAIFFAIASLWPKILRWPSFAWDVVIWVAMALMIVVLLRRIRRMRHEWRDS